jgi:hypothetical protein
MNSSIFIYVRTNFKTQVSSQWFFLLLVLKKRTGPQPKNTRFLSAEVRLPIVITIISFGTVQKTVQ